MKEYEASIQINNILNKMHFETDLLPVDYIWERYGMDVYIEYVKEINTEEE